MDDLAFIYTNSVGETNHYELRSWKEEGRYISGVTNKGYRTFRKDRVKEYLTAVEFLSEPYTLPPPRVRAEKDNSHSVLFTGFPRVQKASLEDKAKTAGLSIKKSVTKSLVFLVCGPNAGPAKIQKSREQGVFIVNQLQFSHLLETGELIDEEDIEF